MASILRYPDDIIDSSTDYLRLEIIKYTAGGTKIFEGDLSGSGTTSRAASRLSKEKAETTIILPIPGNIGDSNSAGWGEDSINDAAAYGISKITAAIESDSPEAALQEAINVAKDAANMTGTARGANLINAIKSAAIVGAANALGANTSVNGLLARSSGQIINQNVELLFSSVSTRSFNFAFNFTPRSKKEANNVKSIIRSIKEASAPKASPDTLGFLNSPDVFRITYMKGGQKHPFLNHFKICALRNISVNYTASGTYATYDDGTPVHMQMALSFTELNPIYLEDYETVPEGVGY